MKLYINGSYQGLGLKITGQYDIIRTIFPKKLKRGETVYGETYGSGNIEVFNEKGIIGEVPSEYSIERVGEKIAVGNKAKFRL